MLRAAFWSRSSTSPQEGQTWVRTDRLFATRCVQRLPSGNTPLQFWLVYAGGTATTHLPAYAALLVRLARNAAQPASLMLLARWGFRTIHSADLQFFQIDRGILGQQGERGLVVEGGGSRAAAAAPAGAGARPGAGHWRAAAPA